ncbi:hypothetical protein evm_014960 [Chilo suppressalis]|nr:hypothetical protein evm_014960 [Chilo suppressalis]
MLADSLEESGIRGSLLEWCKNYLQNRTYSVKVDDAISNKVHLAEGTAQGSVLGPLHYITYVNNRTNVIKTCEMYQFADDTCLLAADPDVNTALKKLQTDFTLLCKWSHDNGLVLNDSKTKVMYISTSQNRKETPIVLVSHNHNCLHTNNFNTNCCCDALKVVKNQTYLGLIIDDRLTWADHIQHSWIIPTQISRMEHVCAACWRSATQQVQKQQQHDSNRLTLGETTLSGNCSIPVPPPLPEPRLEAVQ